MNKNVKIVFIGPDGSGDKGSICDICQVRRVYFADELLCPKCGSREPITEKEKTKGEFLVNEYDTQPLIATAQPKKDNEDLPKDAYWTDKEHPRKRTSYYPKRNTIEEG